MINATINQQQARKLERDLAKLPKTIRNKILRQELRKAAKPMVAEAKSVTPVRTGLLRKSVKLRAMKRSRKSIGVFVGYGDKNFSGKTFYGSFLEWGWRIGKRKSKADKSEDTRPKVDGRYTLAKLAERIGPGVISSAISAISTRVDKAWRNG